MARYLEAYRLGIENEAVFGDGGAFAGAELTSRINTLDVGNSAKEAIKNAAFVRTSAGHHGNIPGLSKAKEGVKFTHYLEGLGLEQGNGDPAPAATAVTRLLDGVMQVAPTTLTGSLAGPGAPSTFVIQEAVAGRHDPGANTIGLAPFARAATPYLLIRPYTYAVDTMTLLMNLPAAPAIGDEVFGGFNMPKADTWTAAGCPRPKGIQFRSNTSIQQFHLKGCIGTLDIPDHGPAEVPVLDFTYKAREHINDLAGVCWSPNNNLGMPAAGGQVLIAAFAPVVPANSRITKSMGAHRVSLHVGSAVQPDQSPNEATGITGWTRTIDPTTLTVTIPLEETPPVDCADNRYEELWLGNQNPINDVHLLVNWGTVSGRFVAFYLPHARVVDWKRAVVDGVSMQTVTFATVDDLLGAAAGTSHSLIAFQG